MAFFITEATNSKKKEAAGKRNKPRNEDLVDPDDYMPKRFGLRYDPPTIVLEYMVMSLGKLYHHKMKLMRLTVDSDINEMVDYLYSRHSFYLKENVVSRQQLANLIIRLQKRLELRGTRGAVKENKAPVTKKVESQVNRKTPEKIPSSYLPSVNQSKPKEDDGWGDDWGDDGWGDSNDNQDKDYNNYDLNKLTTEELKKEKAKMDVNFEKNRKKPEDKDFQYDVRKEFKAPKEE